MRRVMVDLWLLPLILLVAVALVIGNVAAMAQTAYSEADNGKVITVSSGDTFTIKLYENPSTGYSWNLTLSNGLQLVSDQYVADEVPADIVGSGGNHVWIVKAVTPGSYVISGTYKRPWEQVSDGQKTFMLTVNVQSNNAITDIYYPSIDTIQDMFPSVDSSWFDLSGILKNLPDLSQYKFL
jgi:inhibitor of cysteine peptidase